MQDHYRRIYFETIDLLIDAIHERFQQRGYLILQQLESILTEKNPGIEIAQDIAEFYGTDLHQDRLKAQVTALHCSDTDRSLDVLQSIVSHLKGLNEFEKEYYSEVIKLAKLILVMPATNALSKHSFSALRRLKTWLRTTTDQFRLNNCMTLHVHN